MTKPVGNDADTEAAATRALLAQLRALPPQAPDRTAAERTRLRARSLFTRLSRRPRSPLLAAIGRIYDRAEPALATVLVLAYLSWAFQTAAGLIR